MNYLNYSKSIGSFFCGFHIKKPVIIYYHAENIKLFDFYDLTEVSSLSMKNSIVSAYYLDCLMGLKLKFVVITEDQLVHVVGLKNNCMKIINSIDLGQSCLMNYGILICKSLKLYIISENGRVLSISKGSNLNHQLSWPPKNMSKILMIHYIDDFIGQKSMGNNLASFVSYNIMKDTGLVSSWIYDFEKKEVFNGPFTLQISPYSLFLSPSIFFFEEGLFSIYPYSLIKKFDKFCYVSSTTHGNIYLVDSSNRIFCYNAKGMVQIGSSPNPVTHVLGFNNDYVIVNRNGNIFCSKTQSMMRIPYMSCISGHFGLFCANGLESPCFFPITAPILKPLSSVSISKNGVTSNSGGKWSFSNECSSSNTYKGDKYEYIIITTSATVHILKSHFKNPSVLPIIEKNAKVPVVVSAINETLFAISCIDNTVHCENFSGEEYKFSFSSGFCTTMSMSALSLACGFADGSIIITSIQGKSPIISVRPFRVPVKQLYYSAPDKVYLSWGEISATISHTLDLEWNSAPSFSNSDRYLLENGLISMSSNNEFFVYSFPDKKLLLKVPTHVKLFHSYRRRITCLTSRNELLIFHYHKKIVVETQALLDLISPLEIAINESNVYILCQKTINVFDFEGKEVEIHKVEEPYKFFDVTKNGFYVSFSKFVWFISTGNPVIKIQIDKSTILQFCCIDETRFCVSTSSRIVLFNVTKSKHNTICRIEKNIIGLKCYCHPLKQKEIHLAVLYDDISSRDYCIPD